MSVKSGYFKQSLHVDLTSGRCERRGLSDAFLAGKDDDARRLATQLREKRPALVQIGQILPTWMELDGTKTMQAERGKDKDDEHKSEPSAESLPR